ncbi:MAG: nuclear transport factor 2 family protein [Ignavibacteriales bacterium]|nr:nuclear transport factor 2 family protein [Ignavibacteriales bacterium]
MQKEELTEAEKSKIATEINTLFEKSLKAGESLDINGITENVNDTLRAGFIDNGVYFKSFNERMSGFKNAINGIDSQEMAIVNIKITILSPNVVLLASSGNYKVKISDGRILEGKFAWTFVYSKINNEWKIVHTHMSNPK